MILSSKGFIFFYVLVINKLTFLLVKRSLLIQVVKQPEFYTIIDDRISDFADTIDHDFIK